MTIAQARTTWPCVLASYDLDTLAGRLRRSACQPGEAAPVLSEGDKQAAVAVILRAASGRSDSDSEVLLIRRAEREGDPWSGQMALPGGRRDVSDKDLLATAVRETEEEIGLDLRSNASLLTCLPELPAVARARRVGMVIQPFVFVLEQPLSDFRLNHEVAEVVWASVGPMARGELNSTYPYHHEDRLFEMPCFNVSGRVVWGLTHRMLSMLFDRFRDF